MSLLKVRESSFPVLSGDLISELNKVSRDNIFLHLFDPLQVRVSGGISAERCKLDMLEIHFSTFEINTKRMN